MNISAKRITELNTLIRDNYDKTTQTLCALKFRTNVASLPDWKRSIESFYDNSSGHSVLPRRPNRDESKVIVKIREDTNMKTITVTLFASGSVTVQGDFKEMLEFEKSFDEMRPKVRVFGSLVRTPPPKTIAGVPLVVLLPPTPEVTTTSDEVSCYDAAADTATKRPLPFEPFELSSTTDTASRSELAMSIEAATFEPASRIEPAKSEATGPARPAGPASSTESSSPPESTAKNVGDDPSSVTSPQVESRAAIALESSLQPEITRQSSDSSTSLDNVSIIASASAIDSNSLAPLECATSNASATDSNSTAAVDSVTTNTSAATGKVGSPIFDDDSAFTKFRNLENEMISMDRRYTSKFEQLQKLIGDVVAKEVVRAVSSITDGITAEIHASKGQLKALLQDSLETALEDNRQLRHKNEIQQGVIDAQRDQLEVLSDKLRIFGEASGAVHSPPDASSDDQLANRQPAVRSYRDAVSNGQRSEPTPTKEVPCSGRADESTMKATMAKERIDSSRKASPPASRTTKATGDQAIHDAARPSSRQDQPDAERQRAGLNEPPSARVSRRELPELEHLIVADSMTRNIQPRQFGQNVRVVTMRGRKIADATKFILSDECRFDPTTSVTFHLGVNNVSTRGDNVNDRSNQNDQIEDMLADYRDLIDAARDRFPSAAIFISLILRRSYDGKVSRARVDAVNQTIDIVNDELRDIVRRERGVRFIAHRHLDEDLSTREDGLHLSSRGDHLFAQDIRFNISSDRRSR